MRVGSTSAPGRPKSVSGTPLGRSQAILEGSPGCPGQVPAMSRGVPRSTWGIPNAPRSIGNDFGSFSGVIFPLNFPSIRTQFCSVWHSSCAHLFGFYHVQFTMDGPAIEIKTCEMTTVNLSQSVRRPGSQPGSQPARHPKSTSPS